MIRLLKRLGSWRSLNLNWSSYGRQVKEAAADIQKLIDACYKISPPIPKKAGIPRPRPDVQQLGPQKAIRKMIFLYHPDKIDKCDMRQKFLSEEITKLFTERC